ncbi:MAG: lytic polysaccharide monooxygenase [Colwellia sp.]|nr:lytic polysaccharide monooxygenase [Colwellia sp.]
MKNINNIHKKRNKQGARLSSLMITSASLSMVMAMLLPNKIHAHAFMENPKARQSICEAQGGYWWPTDGSNIPNLACRAAFLESGYVQFVQEHEISVNVADYYDQQAVENAVTDGLLCSAGSYEKRGINLASAHWQKTKVMPNEQNKIQIRFNAKTPHNPSFWKIYLSKPSFNASTDVLRWQDLELVQEHGDIDFIKSPDGNRYYDMEVSIPENRSGDALLYSRWQRNDVVGEGFYNCSDITIVRDGVDPQQWQSIGYFIKQGQVANVGDSVWLRLFSDVGQELINQTLEVTASNSESWQTDFATLLNEQYNQQIKVGIKNQENHIVFDENNLLSNKVWVTDENYSFALTIVTQSTNTAPVVAEIADLTLDENSQTSVHVHAFDDQNDPLTFIWHLNAPLTLTGEGADITLHAADIDSDQSLSVSVDVSDGKLTTSRSFMVTIKNSGDIPDFPAWDANTAYKAGDKVSYQNKTYQAKWWNKNQQPNISNAWLEVAPDNGDLPQWNNQTAYPGGSEVVHNGDKYKAKWWTQGEEPGDADVWLKQ